MDRKSTVIAVAACRKSVSRMGGELLDGAREYLFALIQAPQFKSVTQKDLLDFLVEREAYENIIASQSGMKPVTCQSNNEEVEVTKLDVSKSCFTCTT